MNTRGSGYTILEVLIFIAISAFIFVAAMVAVNGRQQQVQFSQSVREFDAKISDVINDVTTGYFPTDNSVSCSVSGDGTRPILGSAGPTGNGGIGTNSDCLYVGKALQFVPSPSEFSDNETKFIIYNLVGRRYVKDTVTVKTIDDTKPRAISSQAEVAELRFGVRITKVFDVTSGTETEYGLMGILSNFEGNRPSSSVSSSQSAQIGGINTTESEKFKFTKDNAISTIDLLNNEFDGTKGYINTDSDSGVVICLRDLDNRKASVTVGANGSSSTLLQFDEYDLRCDS